MAKTPSNLRAIKSSINFLTIAVILAAALALFYELFSYSSGSTDSFKDLPRSFPPYLFFDFHIWSANLRDCGIPVHLITLENSCSNNLYPFGYPVYPLYLLRLLPLTASSHITLSLILGTTSIVCISGLSIIQILSNQSIKVKLVIATSSFIALNTLPFRLLIERGQIDQVVLICIALICCIPIPKFSAKWSAPVEILIYLLWAVASLSKIFPIIGMLTYWAFNTKFSYPFSCRKSPLSHPEVSTPHIYTQRTQYGWAVLKSSIVIITVALLIPAYFDAASIYYPNIDSLGYGLRVLSNAAYINDSPTLTYSFKIFVLVLSSAFGFTALVRSTMRSSTNTSNTLFTIGDKSTADQRMLFYTSVCIVPAYLTTYSIAYKLALLALILPALSKMTASDSFALRTISSYVMTAYLLSCFFVNNPTYNPTLYVYKEWLVHFFLHPLFTGLLISLICYCIFNTSIYQRLIASKPLTQTSKR